MSLFYYLKISRINYVLDTYFLTLFFPNINMRWKWGKWRKDKALYECWILELSTWSETLSLIHLTSLYGELYLPWGFSFKVSLGICGSGENYHWKSFKSPIMYSLLGFLYIILFFSNHSQFFPVLRHGTVSTGKLQWNDAVPNVGICRVCSLEFMPWKEAYGPSACGILCSRLGVMEDDLAWALQAGNQTREE